MVENDVAQLDRVFHALASAPRREILRRTAHERCTVGQLAAHFDMSLAAVAKHVKVLEDAALLRATREGRLHWCELDPAALEPARASIEELRAHWNGKLDRLEAMLIAELAPGPRTPRRTTKRAKGRRR
ncbi:ArsR/SmtB family transcription factor [Sandaracinus amylolyticus]|uniref:Transcriptional regulator, ArsR family protein n=1 Tax=Sandaracinus amylolyticus TaxID=927083 RepID=A0A0F6VYM5_9BACT|nr:metalloregulator ArsR/SmtB family transcription factor [Sandaracinus amylolyticus]AKF02950.1 Transcriptional regulator, ArsR family protein [Sandaracinus amylolyticus]